MKRNDYISWDELFMGIALLSAMRSKDPNTQVGACIVNEDKRVVGLGYNGFPRDCHDDEFPWAGSDSGKPWLEQKYLYVAHSELNAIMNAQGSLKGCIIYCAYLPCNECMKLIIQSGIKEVVYLEGEHLTKDSMVNVWNDSHIASKRMADAAGVELRPYHLYRELSYEPRDS